MDTGRFECYKHYRVRSQTSTERNGSSPLMKQGVEYWEYYDSGRWVVKVIAMQTEPEIVVRFWVVDIGEGSALAD